MNRPHKSHRHRSPESFIGFAEDVGDRNLVETTDDAQELVNSYHLGLSHESLGITWYKATFLIVNAALGAGLLNFPLAFHETGGILAGNFIHLVFLAFSLGSLIILGICASTKQCRTYQEVIMKFCGLRWSAVCSSSIALYGFVTCVTFIIIIGDQFDRVFASFYGAHFCHNWYLNRKFTMVISSLLLVFPSCLKRIDGLQLMSYVGVASVCYLVVVIVVEMGSGSYPKGEVLLTDFNFYKVFNVVPTICFGYQCHVSSVPIYYCLSETNKFSRIKACTSAIVVCLVVYSIGANCGYITFGSLVESDILLSYNAAKPHVLIAILLLAIKSWTTYPILLFCVREAVSDLHIQLTGLTVDEAALSEELRRKAIAVVLWASSILFAVFTPNLDTVVKLLGSLAALFILIFPGLCLLYHTFELFEVSGMPLTPRYKLLIGVSCLYIVLGTFTFGLAFSLGCEEMLNPEVEIPICT